MRWIIGLILTILIIAIGVSFLFLQPAESSPSTQTNAPTESSADTLRQETANIITDLETASNNVLIIASNRRGIWLYQIDPPQLTPLAKESLYSLTSMDLMPDGHSLLASFDDGVYWWDISTRDLIHVFEGPDHGILSVTASPDGKTLVAGTWGTALLVWDLAEMEATPPDYRVIYGEETDPRCCIIHGEWSLDYSPDGKTVVSGSTDGMVRLWDVEKGSQIAVFTGHEGSFWVGTYVAYSPDGKTVVSGSAGDSTVRVWHVGTGVAVRTLKEHTAAVLSVAYAPDGQTVISGAGDGTVRLWDVVTGELLRVFDGQTDDSIHSVAYSDDGQSVFAGSYNGNIHAWDVATGTEIFSFNVNDFD